MPTTITTAAPQPIKILFCIDKLLRGGTELQLIGLIERLDPQYYQPYLLTIRPTDPALIPHQCIHLDWQVPKLFSPKGIMSLYRLINFIRRERIQIVQTFFQDSTIFGGLAAYLARTPIRIACFRDLGFWHNRRQAKILHFIYHRMTHFICNAHIVKTHFSQLFQLAPEKMTVLRNGIDVASLPFIDHQGPSRHIGIVGNMTRHVKRTDLFIQAAGIVAKTHPELTWHILGDGHLRPELEALAHQCGLEGKIIFAGRIEAVSQYLEQLDIAIICSDSEGLSNALLEYMFKGCASVATSVGGNPELVIPESSGLLVPPNDAFALAQAITRLVENDDFRRAIAQRARLQVENEYNWEHCVAAHHMLYCETLAQRTI